MIIISKDTVWSASSIVKLTDDIQIAPGVKLTLEAGVKVEGNGHSVTAFGSFVSAGGVDSKNFIDNLYLNFGSNRENVGQISIKNTQLNEGGLLNPTGNGSYGNLILQDSVINQNAGYSYLWYLLGKNAIKGNIFTGASRIDLGIDGRDGNTIDLSQNVFGSGMRVSVWAAYGETSPLSYKNAYLSDSPETLSLMYGGKLISNNDYFWGLKGSDISSRTKDRSDDLNIENDIDVRSVASAPSTNVPKELFSFVSAALPDAVVNRGVLLGKNDASLVGNQFNNSLVGNAGNNILDGGLGADTMAGGLGDDTYIVDNARDVIVEGRSKGYDSVVASVSYTLSANVERLTLAGTKAINATGNALANHLVGNGAANVLDGKGGADLMEGGAGNDVYFVDHASDRVIEAIGEGRDMVVTTVNYKLAAEQQIEVLQTADAKGKAALKLTGNAFGNKLIGNAGDNVLDGGAGIDEMRGGVGNDTYIVDNVRDVVVEAVGGGADTVLSFVSYALKAGQEIESLRLTGTAGSANLTGNEFGQTLVGNVGANVLDGGLGADVLTGGKGADTFVFSTALGAGNVDRITDFSAVDTIRLSKGVFAALAPGELKASEFKDIAKGKVDADDHILYDSRTGDLFYDADGSGKAAAAKFAVLDNKAVLTHADFFVV